MKGSTVLAISLAVVGVVAYVDFWTGPDLSMLLFYIVPILQASLLGGRKQGVFVAFACALCWFGANVLLSPVDQSPLTHSWNVVTRLVLFLMAAYVASMLVVLRRSLEREKNLSRTDALTGALNGRAFAERVKEELHRAGRYRHHYSIAFVDLDDFKAINDTYGHSEGDRVLRDLATALRAAVRKTDLVGRLGGDEFAVFFPEADAATTAQILTKITKAFERSSLRVDRRTTASIGVLTYLYPSDTYEEMLQRADQLMYEAKSEGKNRVRSLIVVEDDARSLGPPP